MKTEYVAAVEVPDGYFGDKCILHLCFDPESKQVLGVTPQGYFRTAAPLCLDEFEAKWMVHHHPALTNMKLI